MRQAASDAPSASEPSFTVDAARRILDTACRTAGEDATEAELLRLGENAIFRLTGRSRSVVVRVARSKARAPIAQREVCVSRWLHQVGGVPSVRVYENLPDQPWMIDGHPVTFWHAVDPGQVRPTVTDLARLLKSLHAIPDSPCQLPSFAPLDEVRRRLDHRLRVPPADRDYLRSRCSALEAAMAGLELALAPGPIHGDAHTGNLLGHHGNAILSDFEACAVGPREWDLVPLAVGHERLGIPTARWKEFVAEYGFDVRTWSGYPVLREVREIGMTTWLAQNIGVSKEIDQEVARRLASLRNGADDRGWTAF